MKHYIRHQLITILFLVLGIRVVFAQFNQDFILVKLEEASNAELFTQSGHFRSTGSGYAVAGTAGEYDWARAVLTLTDANFRPLRAFRLELELPTLPGQTRRQESYGADVLRTGDNEYVLLAALNMNPFMLLQPGSQNLDFALVKVRIPAGGVAQILWAKRFGGDFNDIPHTVEPTHDGGFIISGYSNAEQALNLPSIALTLLVKTDAQGNLQWARRYRPNAAGCSTLGFQLLPSMLRRPVVQTQDQGFVFTVHCDENAHIVKVNAQGDVLWVRRFEASNSFFDGFFNTDWNFGLGIGAGTGGTIIGIKEMPGGNLAFLGNQFSFFATIWGNPAGNNGLGRALPMGYLFTTDATGNYLKGAAFFMDRFGDPVQPIEMTVHDFQPLPNGNFAVAAGLRSWCNGPECAFTPAVLEIDLRPVGFDVSVVQSREIPVPGGHLASHYPYGLDFIRMAPLTVDGALALYFSGWLSRLSGWTQQNSDWTCTQAVGGLHSFPISIVFQSRDVAWVSLPGAEVGILPFAPISLTARDLCLTSSAETTSPASQGGIQVVPGVSYGRFELYVSDPLWLNAEYTLWDMQGRRQLRGSIQSERQAIDAGQLPSGLYVVRVDREGRRLALRVLITGR